MTKTVLVSGGTKGIGKGAVLQLLKDGFNVAAFSRDKKNCDNLLSEIKKLKINEKYYLLATGDVTKENEVSKILDQTAQKFGSIDILINNAGFGYFADCDKVDMDKFESMLKTNLVGVALLTKLAVPQMKKHKSGLIINLVSISGKRAFTNGEFYSATKFALSGYSEGIRNELKEFGIKVCTICPGMIKTDFFTKEELDRRVKVLGIKNLIMLDVEDINRIISLVCNQSEHCDIQDIIIMPF
ncbi:MAG: SDR family oxidoreductase [Candidatus Aenigmarchaeota archaeon]|nr:SDR family oxidoreductase [Candidatus Aenigmarchaeota archaeon]